MNGHLPASQKLMFSLRIVYIGVDDVVYKQMSTLTYWSWLCFCCVLVLVTCDAAVRGPSLTGVKLLFQTCLAIFLERRI